MEIQVTYEYIDRYVELIEGKLVWKRRVPEDFASGVNSKIQNCNSWNTKYSGKPALDCIDKSHGYKSGTIFGKKIYAHVAMWALTHKRMPEGEIDHINQNRSDNNIQNLRDIPKIENPKNRKLGSKNKYGRHGISFIDKLGKYRLVKSHKHVGLYKTLEEAIEECDKIETLLDFHPNHGKKT